MTTKFYGWSPQEVAQLTWSDVERWARHAALMIQNENGK